MKLIDVDMLCKYCDNNINHSITPNEFMRMPFVDAEPVRHGQWIHDGGGYDGRDDWYHCSECNRSLNLICGRKLEDFPYCHCGAKMNGGEDK